jgi:hypothetical protein
MDFFSNWVKTQCQISVECISMRSLLRKIKTLLCNHIVFSCSGNLLKLNEFFFFSDRFLWVKKTNKLNQWTWRREKNKSLSVALRSAYKIILINILITMLSSLSRGYSSWTGELDVYGESEESTVRILFLFL